MILACHRNDQVHDHKEMKNFPFSFQQFTARGGGLSERIELGAIWKSKALPTPNSMLMLTNLVFSKNFQLV